MADRPLDLPEFENPPVVEVVLSVQFSELRDFRTVHAGLLWDKKFRKQFPIFSEHGPIDPRFETFGPQTVGESKLHLVPLNAPALPRLWFINRQKTELVQIQGDRFIHNWRKVKHGTVYPRYENIKRKFFREFRIFEKFLEEESIGKIEPNQCEVAYVNHIEYPDNTDVRKVAERVFRVISPIRLNIKDLGASLPEFEDMRFSSRYIIRNDEKTPIGRLAAFVKPGTIEGDRPIISFELTARGVPQSADLDGVSKFFDIGREAIVRGFTAMTTPKMHEVWKRMK